MSEPVLRQVFRSLILPIAIQAQGEQVDRVGALGVVGVQAFGDKQGGGQRVGVQGLPYQRSKLRDDVWLRYWRRHVGDICRHGSGVRSRVGGALGDGARGRDWGGDLT